MDANRESTFRLLLSLKQRATERQAEDRSREILSAAARIERLQEWRGGRPDNLATDTTLAALHKKLKRDRRRIASIVELWEKCVVPELAVHTTLKSLRSGVLTVLVDSSSALFELDRVLRSGAEQKLRATGIVHEVSPRLGRITEPVTPRAKLEPHEEALLDDEDWTRVGWLKQALIYRQPGL